MWRTRCHEGLRTSGEKNACATLCHPLVLVHEILLPVEMNSVVVRGYDQCRLSHERGANLQLLKVDVFDMGRDMWEGIDNAGSWNCLTYASLMHRQGQDVQGVMFSTWSTR